MAVIFVCTHARPNVNLCQLCKWHNEAQPDTSSQEDVETHYQKDSCMLSCKIAIYAACSPAMGYVSCIPTSRDHHQLSHRCSQVQQRLPMSLLIDCLPGRMNVDYIQCRCVGAGCGDN